MKNAYKNIITHATLVALVTFVTLAALVAVIACKSPVEEATGTITISLGSANGNARAVKWPPENTTLGDLSHKIILTGPGATQNFDLEDGSKVVNFTVAVGKWTVKVEARLSGDLYATGSKEVEIRAGQNEHVQIDMKHAGYRITMTSSNDDGSSDDWGTATADLERAIQGATVTITAEPEGGHRIQKWEVVSGAVTLGSTTANSTSFTMPNDDVAINAVFEVIPPDTPNLYMTAVTFDDKFYGYTPAVENVTLHNNGTADATVSGIALSGTDASSFTLNGEGSITSLAIGASATFTVQPIAGLNAGTYTAAITVTYKGDLTPSTTAPAALSFTVEKLTPVASHYDFGNLSQTAGSVAAVTITPKTGGILVSSGARTIHYEGINPTVYTKSTTLPQTAGTYAVTFDVAAVAPNWNGETGLSAGTLTITGAPAAADFTITGTGTFAHDGSAKAVTVTPQSGKSSGARTIHYEGTSGTIYAKSTTAPSAVGIYTVTFDVAAAPPWTAVSGLSAGTLTITGDPVAGDFTIGNLSQTAGSVTAVTITPQTGKSGGARTIHYEGISPTVYAKTTTLPSAAGTYAVTFDVAAASPPWNAVTGLSAGTLTVGLPAMPANAVTISGTPTVGQTLEAMHTSLTASGTASYQWKRGGADITGGTNKTYTLAAADASQNITVTVSHTGYTGSQTSAAVTVTLPAMPAITITGTARVGQTLTATPALTGTTSYQWKRGNTNVGTDSATYTLLPADIGETITVTVTNSGYSGSPATSASVTVSTTVNIPTDAAWDAIATAIRAKTTNTTYDLIVSGTTNTATASPTSSTFGTSAKTINLSGTGVLNLSGNGNLLSIGNGQTVNMSGLTLMGNLTNYTSLVYIASGGTFNMTGGKVSDNTATRSGGNGGDGGGVYVVGTFNMTGGEVSGNKVDNGGSNSIGNGGGVYVDTLGTFSMSATAKVSGNTGYWYGGGVYVGGAFTMSGGEVSGNTVDTGGGVYVDTSGTFTMSVAAKVSGNRAGRGGGLEVRGTFNMNGGEVSGNSTGTYGTVGGVSLVGGTFNMTGGKVSNNTSAAYAGGVLIGYDSSFNMTGGEISGNKAIDANGWGIGVGGGVYAESNGTFRISNGTIYGTNESDTTLRNTSSDGGAALYIESGTTVQHGTWSGTGGAWVPQGPLSATNDTIHVVNGALQ